MPIAVKLRTLLADRGLSVNELAERTGIARKNLWTLASGRAKAIRFDTLEAICDALTCTPCDLLAWEPSDSPVEAATPEPSPTIPRRELTPLESEVAEAIAATPMTIDEVLDRFGLDAVDAAVVMVELEMLRVIKRRVGGRYERI